MFYLFIYSIDFLLQSKLKNGEFSWREKSREIFLIIQQFFKLKYPNIQYEVKQVFDFLTFICVLIAHSNELHLFMDQGIPLTLL